MACTFYVMDVATDETIDVVTFENDSEIEKYKLENPDCYLEESFDDIDDFEDDEDYDLEGYLEDEC